MIRYFCRECGEEVEDTGAVAYCPAHPGAVIDSVMAQEDAPRPPASDDRDAGPGA